MTAYLLYGLLFFLPFVFFPNLADPFELPKIIFFIFTVTFTISLSKNEILSKNKPFVKTPKIQKLLLLYLAIQFIGSFFGVNFGKSLWGQYYRYQGLITQLAFFGFFYLISRGKTLGLSKENIFKTIGLSGIAVSILAISQGVLFYLFNLPIYTFNGRMTAFFGNPNFAGGFLVLSAICAFWYLPPPKVKYGKLIFPILFSAAILLTFSRGAILAFVIVVFFSFLFRTFSLKNLALIFIFALMVGLFYPVRQASPFENRQLIWQKGVEAFLKRPILGWGLENFEEALKSTLTNERFDLDLKNIRVDKAHNEILEIAIASGIFGLLAWFLIVFQIFSNLWKKRKEKWAKTSLLIFLTFLSLSQVNVLNINQYLFFYLIAGWSETD